MDSMIYSRNMLNFFITVSCIYKKVPENLDYILVVCQMENQVNYLQPDNWNNQKIGTYEEYIFFRGRQHHFLSSG